MASAGSASVDLAISWDAERVAMSYILSFVGALTAIAFNEHRRVSEASKSGRFLSVVAFAMGGVGIWGMHFVGMSGIRLSLPHGKTVPIDYEGALILCSLLVSVTVCYAGVWVASTDAYWKEVMKEQRIEMMRRDVAHLTMAQSKSAWVVQYNILLKRPGRICLGGLIVGIGVGAMHYLGMHAQRFSARMTFHAGWVVLSLGIAVLVGTVGIFIIFRLLQFRPYEWLRKASAALLGLAVCGMHYTGMYGVTYHYSVDARNDDEQWTTVLLRGDQMSRCVGFGGVVVCFFLEGWLRQQLREHMGHLYEADRPGDVVGNRLEPTVARPTDRDISTRAAPQSVLPSPSQPLTLPPLPRPQLFHPRRPPSSPLHARQLSGGALHSRHLSDRAADRSQIVPLTASVSRAAALLPSPPLLAVDSNSSPPGKALVASRRSSSTALQRLPFGEAAVEPEPTAVEPNGAEPTTRGEEESHLHSPHDRVGPSLSLLHHDL